jgi:hypothetical protein
MAASRRRKPPAKNATGDEFATFTSALTQVLSVSHAKIKSRINSEKKKRHVKKPFAREVGEED